MALLLPNPHDKQREFLADSHRYKVLNWGRRSGKSVGVWEKVVLRGNAPAGYLLHNCPYLQASQIYLLA
jgi:hypothetical protein